MASSIISSLLFLSSIYQLSQSSPIFREYIGAEDNGVKFSDVPINPNLKEFHFILSFAIDYASPPSINSYANPSPTNGYFQAYWDTHNLSPQTISSLKSLHPNVKVAMSLGGDTTNSGSVGVRISKFVYFKPTSVASWVSNAIHSITYLANKYNLDGIDIDYEHFEADPDTFAECIGRLLFYLKDQSVISFASIAPYQNDTVQPHYVALRREYGHLIDYVNFQFYAYDKETTVSQFLEYYEVQRENYVGGKVLVSFGTDGSGGLAPDKGFFVACEKLRERDELHGIFVWSADDSKKDGFRYEIQAQALLANTR